MYTSIYLTIYFLEGTSFRRTWPYFEYLQFLTLLQIYSFIYFSHFSCRKPQKNRGQESSLEDFETVSDAVSSFKNITFAAYFFQYTANVVGCLCLQDQLAEHETSSHSSPNQPPHTSDHRRSSDRFDTEATADEFEGFEEVHVEDAHTPEDMQTPESCHTERNIQEHAPKSKNHMEDFTSTDPHTHDDAHKKQAFTVRNENSKDKVQEELVEHERNDPALESEEKAKKGTNMETMEIMSENTNILRYVAHNLFVLLLCFICLLAFLPSGNVGAGIHFSLLQTGLVHCQL